LEGLLLIKCAIHVTTLSLLYICVRFVLVTITWTLESNSSALNHVFHQMKTLWLCITYNVAVHVFAW